LQAGFYLKIIKNNYVPKTSCYHAAGFSCHGYGLTRPIGKEFLSRTNRHADEVGCKLNCSDYKMDHVVYLDAKANELEKF